MSRTTSVTISAEQRALLVAILEGSSAKPKGKKGKKAMPKGLKAAKKHCYEARMTRRANTPLGGLTKAERQQIARKLEAKHGEYSRAQWEKAVAKFKAAN